MAENGRRCAKCGSVKVVPQVRVKDASSARRLAVEYDEHPEALVFKGTVAGSVAAMVCGRCGYLELYTDTAGEMWAAHERRTNKRREG